MAEMHAWCANNYMTQTGAYRMKLKAVLTVSAIYLAVLGIGFMLVPREIGIEAVPAEASPALIAYLRIFGGPFLGIAVLNWLARDLEPSAARRAIVLANIVGFGFVTLVDVWGVFSGGAREIAKVFLVIHLLITLAFIMAGRADMRVHRS
jgi:uncharacterized membrane protein